MNNIMKIVGEKKILVLIFGLLNSVILSAQTDTEFWFAAPEITYEFVSPSPIPGSGMDRPIALHLATFETAAIVMIDQPANPAFVPIQQNLIPGVRTTINLTPFIDNIENKPANTILDFGLRIRSSKPIACSALTGMTGLYPSDINSVTPLLCF